jgi:lipoyl synthase
MTRPALESAGTLPSWFRQELPDAGALERMREHLQHEGLNTVCQGAHCPNLGRGWNKGTATFMILGDTCTRSCGFCAVKSGTPKAVGKDEPQAVARVAKSLGLRYIVITSVTRDDLADEGAVQFARTIRALKESLPEAKVEVLLPDMHARADLIKVILDEKPDVIGHNVETVRRISPVLRPQAGHDLSLSMLAAVRTASADVTVKSGFMVGLGETDDEALSTLDELKSAGCDIVTIGQYLAPAKSERHAPVVRYVAPEKFEQYRAQGMKRGLRYVVAGPLVRSSYLAEEGFEALTNSKGRAIA